MRKRLGDVIAQSIPGSNSFHFSRQQVEALKTSSQVALAVIAALGAVAVAAVAPNLFSALGKLYKLKGKSYVYSEKRRQLIRAIYYLKKKGLIEFKGDGSNMKVFLTKLGFKKAKQVNFFRLRIESEKKWDKKWWQVAADIPTKDYKRAADLFRKKLKELGFYSLQRTLWYFPFNPRKEMSYIIEYFGISQFVTVMEVSRMDIKDEEVLLKHFKKLRVL